MKRIRLCIGILAFALMMPMSGCSVSISFGTNKDTEAEKETEEKTEKKTETEEQEEKTAEPTEKPKEITATPTPTPEAVQEKPVSTPEPEVKEQPVQQKTPQYVTYYVVNCKQSITLRPGPDVSSGEICQIPLGAAVSYIESAENGFYKINYNGKPVILWRHICPRANLPQVHLMWQCRRRRLHMDMKHITLSIANRA
nr:SH3 domain-containing protein [uncultured Blautia sp.]